MSSSSPETLPESGGSRTPSPTFSGTSSVDSGFESVEQELHDAAKNVPVEGKRPDGASPNQTRKECELCDKPFPTHVFGKHMANVHLARWCTTCREYLPVKEEGEHKRLHAEPSYKGKKIR